MQPELSAMFDQYLASLADFSDADVGGVLDVAKAIKTGVIEASGNPDYAMLFERPRALAENFAFRNLRLWRHQMLSEGGTVEGQAKIGGLMVWYLSLAAAHFPEFAPRAAALWRDLHRGAEHCAAFDPAADGQTWYD